VVNYSQKTIASASTITSKQEKDSKKCLATPTEMKAYRIPNTLDKSRVFYINNHNNIIPS